MYWLLLQTRSMDGWMEAVQWNRCTYRSRPACRTSTTVTGQSMPTAGASHRRPVVVMSVPVSRSPSGVCPVSAGRKPATMAVGQHAVRTGKSISVPTWTPRTGPRSPEASRVISAKHLGSTPPLPPPPLSLSSLHLYPFPSRLEVGP